MHERSAVLVVPGSLETRTGGYIYDRRMVEELRRLGWSVDVVTLDGSFPWPSLPARAAAAEAFDQVADGSVVLVDSLALGVIPDIVERHASRVRIVALMHLPLAAGVGLASDAAARLAESEGRAVRAASLVVTTGAATRSMMAAYAVPSSRLVVVEPGTDRAPISRGSTGSPVRLLCVATLNPGKGHLDLLTALAATPSREWYLTCAGSLTRHPETSDRVAAAVRDLGLSGRVSCVGDLDREALEEVYDCADVCVLATLRETYGMAAAEAIAHGIPVVGTATGAIPDLVGSDAGLLVPPGDIAALTSALSRVILDPALRLRLAAGARAARERLPRWEHQASRLGAILESVIHG